MYTAFMVETNDPEVIDKLRHDANWHFCRRHGEVGTWQWEGEWGQPVTIRDYAGLAYTRD